jgi:hypothetical protein
MPNYNEKEINELMNQSPQMLELLYKNSKTNELMHDPEFLKILKIERKRLEMGISGSEENIEKMRLSDQFNGNDLWDSKVREAIDEFAEDIILLPFKVPGRVFQVSKSLYEAAFKEDTLEGFKSKILDALISIPDALPGMQSFKTIFLERMQETYKLKGKFKKASSNLEDHISDIKSKLNEVDSEINRQEMHLSDAKAFQENILKKHPEFSKFDSEIHDAVNAQKKAFESRFSFYKFKFGETSGGASSGNGSTSHSANVFTRIAELLQSIDAKILQVQSNLQI